jgi:hypothetical protein
MSVHSYIEYLEANHGWLQFKGQCQTIFGFGYTAPAFGGVKQE